MKIEWPMFKWSHDSKYIARHVQGKDGAIYVYETPRMALVKPSIKIENLRTFEWSPADAMLSYWTAEPEVGNIPARVSVVKFPSREIVRTKNLFSVVSVSIIIIFKTSLVTIFSN